MRFFCCQVYMYLMFWCCSCVCIENIAHYWTHYLFAIPTLRNPLFYYMLGANLGCISHGDVSMMSALNLGYRGYIVKVALLLA